jgi:hypothetical protein
VNPHTPQLAGSLVVLTHMLPHLVVPPVQASVQALPLQTCPAAQTFAQAPQFNGSFVVLTHELPHLVVPPEQDRVHAPALHTCPAGQANPHAPQLLSSAVRSRQFPEQFVKPL